MRLTWLLDRRKRVYVDAKVLGIHDPKLQRFAYVCYVVEGSDLRNARPSNATESDDAEIDAIIFALQPLPLSDLALEDRIPSFSSVRGEFLRSWAYFLPLFAFSLLPWQVA